MGKFKKLQEDIENVTNKEVVKQTRISGVATIVLIISVACAIGGMSFEDPNSSMPTFLFTASALLFLSGVIKLLVDRSCYMFKPTKSKLKTMTMYFDVHESDNLQDCMEMKRFEDLKKLGVVVKRAQYFLTCGGRMPEGLRFSPATLPQQLALAEPGLPGEQPEQLSLFNQAGVAV